MTAVYSNKSLKVFARWNFLAGEHIALWKTVAKNEFVVTGKLSFNYPEDQEVES